LRDYANCNGASKRSPAEVPRRSIPRAEHDPRCTLRTAHFDSVTAHVPGVQFSVMDELVLDPVHDCGPLRVTFPVLVTEPVKLSNGGAKDSVQPLCVTMAVLPTSDVSQCFVTVQLPVRLGQAADEPPPLPAPDVPPVVSEELELHAPVINARVNEIRTRIGLLIIAQSYETTAANGKKNRAIAIRAEASVHTLGGREFWCDTRVFHTRSFFGKSDFVCPRVLTVRLQIGFDAHIADVIPARVHDDDGAGERFPLVATTRAVMELAPGIEAKVRFGDGQCAGAEGSPSRGNVVAKRLCVFLVRADDRHRTARALRTAVRLPIACTSERR